MKMMLGAAFLACSNRSRTREAPTPTNISTNSEALTEKKGAPASPAVALASSVLPVPGEPTKMTPLVILPPSRWKRAGSLRYSVISRNSPTASPAPPTFWKVTPVCSPWMTRALLLPKEKMPPGPPAPPAAPLMLLSTKYPKAPNRTSGSTQPSNARMPPLLATWPAALTLIGFQVFEQVRVIHTHGVVELGRVSGLGSVSGFVGGQLAGDLVDADRGGLDLPGTQRGLELRVGHFGLGRQQVARQTASGAVAPPRSPAAVARGWT